MELLPESVCAVLRTYKTTPTRMLALSRSVRLMRVVQKGQPLPQGRCKLMYCSRGSLWAGLFKGFLYVRLGNTRCATDVQSRHPRVRFPPPSSCTMFSDCLVKRVNSSVSYLEGFFIMAAYPGSPSLCKAKISMQPPVVNLHNTLPAQDRNVRREKKNRSLL